MFNYTLLQSCKRFEILDPNSNIQVRPETKFDFIINSYYYIYNFKFTRCLMMHISELFEVSILHLNYDIILLS